MRRDVARRNAQVSKLAEIISEIGPNVKAASERVAIPTETARYLYKRRLLGRGFTLHATIAYEKLGLQCIILVVRLGQEFEGRAKTILSYMHDFCYVEAYSRTVPFGYYLILASVPREHVAAFIGLMNRMKKAGLFMSLRILRSEWRRDIPMRTDLYDFERNVWNFDWERPEMNYEGANEQARSRNAKVDIKDLEMLAHLQLDGTTSLTDISKEVGVQAQSLRYHHRDHVVRQGLIGKYRLDWSGVRNRAGEQKSPSSKNSYLGMNVIAAGLDNRQKMEARAYFSKFPFFTLEAGGERFYYAEGAVPVEDTLQAYRAMDRIGKRLGFKLEVFVRDPGSAALLGISTRLFVPKTGEWHFDGPKAAAGIKELLQR